jgi:hypothetical protein
VKIVRDPNLDLNCLFTGILFLVSPVEKKKVVSKSLEMGLYPHRWICQATEQDTNRIIKQ